MAFGIMASVFAKDNKLVIEGARTVAKTFPGFWTHISTSYNITYSGFVFSKIENSLQNSQLNLMILVGMRNSGKSTYAENLAQYGWKVK
mmetsp:Transcript_20462/g.18108  ORF Transcript_20462/g.18108 Transcript_20462/m.18108 type:complete len:89 (-) Transcript_20462:567-833(-)